MKSDIDRSKFWKIEFAMRINAHWKFPKGYGQTIHIYKKNETLYAPRKYDTRQYYVFTSTTITSP